MSILVVPKHVTSLQTSASLVAVEVSVWTGNIRDRVTSGEVAHDKGADADAVDVTKKLLAGCAEHRALIRNRQSIYNWLEATTWDWAGRLRVLANARLPKFMEESKAHEERTRELTEEFLTAYPDIVSNLAFAKQGKLFRREDYPSVETLRPKFAYNLFRMPIPAGDFRNAVALGTLEDATADYNRQVDRYVQDITSTMMQQFTTVMESISHCCDVETTVDKDGNVKTRRRKLYDATIHKALEMCDTFKQFNPSDCSRLEEARASLENVLRDVNVEALKESDSMRTHMRNEVSDILSKFKV